MEKIMTMFEQTNNAIIEDIKSVLSSGMITVHTLCKLYNYQECFCDNGVDYTDCILSKNMLDKFFYDLQGNGENSVSEVAETFENEYENIVDNLKIVRDTLDRNGNINGIFIVENYTIHGYIPREQTAKDKSTEFKRIIECITYCLINNKSTALKCLGELLMVCDDNDESGLTILKNHIASLMLTDEIYQHDKD